jgi:hypothetical protein
MPPETMDTARRMKSMPGGGFWPYHDMRKPVPRRPPEDPERVTRTTVAQFSCTVIETPATACTRGPEPLSKLTARSATERIGLVVAATAAPVEWTWCAGCVISAPPS